MGTLGCHALPKDMTKGPKETSDGKHDDSLEDVPCSAGLTEDAAEKVK